MVRAYPGFPYWIPKPIQYISGHAMISEVVSLIGTSNCCLSPGNYGRATSKQEETNYFLLADHPSTIASV
jgi:hypothetical protein